MLAKALSGITSQVQHPEFSHELVVVDNDDKQSAENVVDVFQQNTGNKIIYDWEPEQSISLAETEPFETQLATL